MSGTAMELGFVAALDREVGPAVRGWRRESLQASGRQCRAFLDPGQRAALVCAGVGAERAYEAAKVLVERYGVKILISIGFAGACVGQLRPGALVVPERVVEAASGRAHSCLLGRGTLLTTRGIASVTAKRDAHLRYGALAVEMEAAGVAAAAAKCGAGFAAIKAVYDPAADELEFLAPFMTPRGFATGRFLAHLAPRPWMWPRVASLQRHSRLAAAALAEALTACMANWQGFAAQHAAEEDLSPSAPPGAETR